MMSLDVSCLSVLKTIRILVLNYTGVKWEQVCDFFWHLQWLWDLIWFLSTSLMSEQMHDSSRMSILISSSFNSLLQFCYWTEAQKNIASSGWVAKRLLTISGRIASDGEQNQWNYGDLLLPLHASSFYLNWHLCYLCLSCHIFPQR